MTPLRRQALLPQEALFGLAHPCAVTRPFLKWAGGKTRLLPVLRRALPSTPFRRYFEPFVGGGALFFDLGAHDAILSDSNPDLMSCYEVVRDAPEELLEELGRYRVTE